MFSKEALSLIRYCLSKGEVPKITDWDTVIKECKENAVIPLLSLCRNVVDIPEQYADEIKTITYHNVYHMTKVGQEQQSITDTLSKHSISPVILKGFSLAQYYDNPNLRTYGDMDILLYDEDDFNTAIDELKVVGYSPMRDYEDLSYKGSMASPSRHLEFRKNDVEIELHSRYGGKDVALDDYLKQVKPLSRNVNQLHFWSFPDLENGLMLLQHVKFHLDYDGVGLRMIIDWFYYVKTILSDTLWYESFEKEASRFGLRKLAVCLTKICQMYFGMDERSFTGGFEENICEDFMNLVSASGNFGTNDTKISKTVNKISQKKNLFHILQSRGIAHSSVFEKNKFLCSFAWVYGFLISAKEVLSSSNWLSEVFAGNKHYRMNKQIKEALDLR